MCVCVYVCVCMYVCMFVCIYVRFFTQAYRIRIVCNWITIKEQKRTELKKFEKVKNR